MGFIIGGAKARGEWRGLLRHLFLFFVLVLGLGLGFVGGAEIRECRVLWFI